jgi:uncharacterized membrane protein
MTPTGRGNGEDSAPRAMPDAAGGRWTNEQVEQLLSRVLQAGVALAAAVVLIGGVAYLAAHGFERYHYRIFRGEPADLRTLGGIIGAALALDSRAVIQLGVLLLLATPVARVALSVFAFARQRDLTYVLVTSIVLVLLLASLFAGHIRGTL